MAALRVEYIDIDTLKPYEGNAKIHTEGQIEQIKKSIQDFGMNDPIAVWGPENMIIEGHGRLIACRELGIDKVPVIRLDNLTDEQRRAYALVHNKLTMNTGFDLIVLQKELDELADDVDMADYGFVSEPFDESALDKLFSEETEKAEKGPKMVKCPHCGEMTEVHE